MTGPAARSTDAAARSPWRRLSLRSAVGGLVTAAIVAVIGVALLGPRPVSWTASSELLILPVIDPAEQSNAAMQPPHRSPADQSQLHRNLPAEDKPALRPAGGPRE